MTNEPTPYCACRQNITDIFANQIKISNKMFVGCSMSLDTCPPDVDYRVMVACNGMQKCVNVCTYMDDTLDDLLYMVNTKDFDRTLEALFVDHINYEAKSNPAVAAGRNMLMKKDTYFGYCKSLRTLLEHNNFMYDFYQTFRIVPLDKEVTYDSQGVLNPEITAIISDIYQENIVSTLCMKYWYDIDLEQIDNDYTLIMDKNDNLYVVAYVSSGRKHIDIENVESEENIEKLANSSVGDNKSIKEAAEFIRLNKNKYN
jgi:hypothetical protein